MTKLLQRINGKLCIEKSNRFYEPVELEQLVHAGNELIGFRFGAEQNSAAAFVQKKALEFGQMYGCDYALLGKNAIQITSGKISYYVYIAAFYHEKKKATLKRIK